MNVGELKEILSEYDDNLEIMIDITPPKSEMFNFISINDVYEAETSTGENIIIIEKHTSENDINNKNNFNYN